MGSWGPPLRIARRTTRRHLGRTLLVAALIGLPVLAATVIGVAGQTRAPSGETLIKITIGQADARLTVTPYGKLAESEPSLYGTPGPAEGHEASVRVPATFDPLPLLPPGSTAVRELTDAGTVDIKGPATTNRVAVMIGDGQSPLAKGTNRLHDGRFPATPNEVAVSPSLAKYLGVTVGGIVQDAKGSSYPVVGIAQPRDLADDRWIFAPAGTGLIPLDKDAEVSWLVDLPDSTDPLPLSTTLAGKGFHLLPRASITQLGANTTDAAAAAAIGFGLLEVVLLAGTAFAVGARRQTRELGLVLSAGGTPRDVRRIVLLQGLFAGVVGVVMGGALAAVVLLTARSWWEGISDTLVITWQVPWAKVLLIAALGVLSGLAAAAVPAISASRQPPLAALSGHFAATTARTTIRKPAIVLIIAGVVAVVVGSGLIAAALARVRHGTGDDGHPAGPIVLVLAGIAAVVVGLVWILPSLVGKLAGPAKYLPLSGRLALRDASRHRHRTGPATAAIMMAVAATAGASFAAANGVAANEETYYPKAQLGNAYLPFGADRVGAVPYSTAIEQRVAEQLPTEHVYRFGSVEFPGKSTDGEPLTLEASGSGAAAGRHQAGLIVVDPAYLDSYGDDGRKLADQLRAGEALVPTAEFTDNNAIDLSVYIADGFKSVGPHKATYGGAIPNIQILQRQVLISPAEAARLGKISTFAVEYKLKRPPTDDEVAAVDRVLGHDEVLVVERGFGDPSQLILAGAVGAASIVTLLGVAISVALSAAEGRADLATLAAIGAPPRRRRSLAAAQAWVLGQLGCVLGVGVGALFGYTSHAAFNSPRFEIPWTSLAAIVVLVPLFAGLVAWLLTRSRLPMVARID